MFGDQDFNQNTGNTGINREDENMDGMRGKESIKPVQFNNFGASKGIRGESNIDLLLDVPMSLVVELGRAQMAIKDILGLGPGSIIELDKAAGEPVDLLVNGKLIARGEVVVIDENFGFRVTEIVSSIEKGNEGKEI